MPRVPSAAPVVAFLLALTLAGILTRISIRHSTRCRSEVSLLNPSKEELDRPGCFLNNRLTEGALWTDGFVLRPESGLRLELGGAKVVSEVSLQADCDDEYVLAAPVHGTLTELGVLPPRPCPGLREGVVILKGETEISELRILPRNGDGMYSVGHVDEAILSGQHLDGAYLFLAFVLFLAAVAACISLLHESGAAAPPAGVPGAPRIAYLLLAAATAVSALHAFAFAGEWYGACSRAWLLVTIAGVALYSAAAFSLSARRTRSGRTALGIFGGGVGMLFAVILLARLLEPWFSIFPHGLFWEEHCAAANARKALNWECGPLRLYHYTFFTLGLFFKLFGYSEQALRLCGIIQGIGAALFFAAAAFTLFQHRSAAFVTVLFATSATMVAASHIIEESFAFTILTGCMTLCGFALAAVRGSAWGYLLLGIGLGLGISEYAALKPGIVFVPAGLLLLAPLYRKGAGVNWKAESAKIILMGGAAFHVGMLLFMDLLAGGDSFYEGARKARMIGPEAVSRVVTGWEKWSSSLSGHLEMLFLSGAQFPPIANPRGGYAPLVAPTISLALLFAVTAAAFSFFKPRNESERTPGPSRAAYALTALFFLSWALFLILYCSYFNDHEIMSRRLYLCVPLLLLALGAAWSLLPFTASTVRLMAAFILTLHIGRESLSYFGSFSVPFIKSKFVSRTHGLCPALAAMPADQSWLYLSAWDVGHYFGDTARTEWVEKPCENGCDSWECTSTPKLTWGGDPEALPPGAGSMALESYSGVAITLRAPDRAEFMEEAAVRDELRERMLQILARLKIDESRCKLVQEEWWYLHALCGRPQSAV